MRRVASRLKNESRRLRKTCPASGIPRVYQARTQANDAVREETNPTQERTIMSHPIHLEVSLPASPERYYELLINGAKLGDVTGQPGKGGGSEGAYFELFGGWLQAGKLSSGKTSGSRRRGASETGIRACTRSSVSRSSRRGRAPSSRWTRTAFRPNSSSTSGPTGRAFTSTRSRRSRRRERGVGR